MKRFFHDISWVQILAGALAAVTAFLLSSRIGIAGSVIGVAVGSIVSAFASQLYQNVLDESSKKLHDTVGSTDDGVSDAASGAGGGSTSESGGSDAEETRTIVGLAGAIADAEAGEAGASGDPQTRVLAATSDATSVMDPAVTRMATSDSTSVLGQGNGGESLEDHHSNGQTSAGDNKPRIAASAAGAKDVRPQGAHVHPGQSKTASSAKSGDSKKIKRNVIIVSVVSALLAVGITAGIIYAVTGGQGTDRVLTPSETPSSVQTTPSGESTPTTDSDGTGSNSGGSESSGSSTQNPTSSSSSSSSPTSSSDSSSSSTSTPTSTSSPSTSTATPTQSPTSSSSSSSSSTSGGNNNAAASGKSSSSPSTGSAQAEE